MPSQNILLISSFLTTSCTVHGFENVLHEVEEEGHGRVDTTFKLNVKGTTNFGGLVLIGRITSEAGPGTGQSLLHVCIQLRYNIPRSCKVLNISSGRFYLL